MLKEILQRLWGRRRTAADVDGASGTAPVLHANPDQPDTAPAEAHQLDRPLSGNTKTPASNRVEPRSAVTPIPALLLVGVDFGTAYTKVVWRDWGGVRVGVASVGSEGDAIIPSVVWVDGDGELHLDNPGKAAPERLLKMRLAANDPMDRPIAEISALCVYFLGSVLRRTLAAARVTFPGRPVSLYEAALGCPAAHCDDEHLIVFQDVAKWAWRWTQDPEGPTRISDLIEWMRDEPTGEPEGVFDVRPEVAAAVDCFTMRPDAEEGRYLFLDVGGGTLDGACFVLYREDQKIKVTVLATAVESLGVEILAAEAAEVSGDDIDALRNELFEPGVVQDPKWAAARSRVGGFIGRVMVEARRGDLRTDWMASQFPRPRAWTSPEDRLDLARRLPVFFGGGGMACPLYRFACEKAGYDLSKNYDVPRFAIGEATPPDGFEGVSDIPFHRFAVAYGLTRPFTQTPGWKLPGKADSATRLGQRMVADRHGVDYLSSRDAYD